MLVQFKYSEEESRKKAMGGDPSQDEDMWFCNGGADFGFKAGCKGKQKDFDYHETMSGWMCPDTDNCDFDLCEHCVRWILHCDNDKLDLGVIEPQNI